MPKSRGRKPKKKRARASAPKKRLDNFNTTPQELPLSTQPPQEPPLATAPRQEQPAPKIKKIAKLTTAVVLAVKDIPQVGPLQWGRINLGIGRKSRQFLPAQASCRD